jgi:protein-tyrosine phosphatase
VIDLHAHVLPGVDDGALRLDESLAICRTAVLEGTVMIAATPHVRDDYPTAAAVMEHHVRDLRRALAEEAIPLEIRPGGEIAIEWLARLSTDELRRFGLAGNPDYLLVEFAHYGWPDRLRHWISDFGARGTTLMLAHPERSTVVQAQPERLRPLVEAGALVQVTAASIDGRVGRRPQATALELIESGLAHTVASDVHQPGPMLEAALQLIGDEELARWLTHELPTAIVDGRPLPRRPGTSGRSRRLAR